MSSTTTAPDPTDTSGPPRGHRLVPAVLAVGGLAATAASIHLGLGSASEPGPGAWPLVASLGVLLTSTWLTVTGVDRPEPSDPGDLARVAVAVLAVAAFVVLLPLVGMPVPAGLVVLAWMRLFGEPWRTTVLTAVLGVVVLQVVFVQLLAVPLPVGPLAPGR